MRPLGTVFSWTALCAILAIALLPLWTPSSKLAAAGNRIDGNQQCVRIGVFGLFHPTHLTVTAIPGHALLLRSGSNQAVLERSSATSAATLQLSGSDIAAAVGPRIFHSPDLLVAGRNGELVDFQLGIAGKITRHYHGTLELHSSGREIAAIVTMDMETAVASVVAAETTSDTPVEALKAQAIATRSYLISGRGRHVNFDFCDTTHCQFLRDPPQPGTAIARVVQATRGLVLTYNFRPFPAMYTRSCSGKTHTPAELGLSSGDYPYYSVECKHCLSHPAHWTSHILVKDAESLHSSDEASRLEVVRHLGWNTVPSNDFSSIKHGNEVFLRGTGYGHGIGLCQAGAKAMAQKGMSFQQILAHYYPNTSVIEWTHAN